MDPEEQFEKELVNLLDRYQQESDLSLCQVIGVLETVKHQLIKASYEAAAEGGSE